MEDVRWPAGKDQEIKMPAEFQNAALMKWIKVEWPKIKKETFLFLLRSCGADRH